MIPLPKSLQWHKGIRKSWILVLAESTSVATLTQLFSRFSCYSPPVLFSENAMHQNPQSIVHLAFVCP